MGADELSLELVAASLGKGGCKELSPDAPGPKFVVSCMSAELCLELALGRLAHRPQLLLSLRPRLGAAWHPCCERARRGRVGEDACLEHSNLRSSAAKTQLAGDLKIWGRQAQRFFK